MRCRTRHHDVPFETHAASLLFFSPNSPSPFSGRLARIPTMRAHPRHSTQPMHLHHKLCGDAISNRVVKRTAASLGRLCWRCWCVCRFALLFFRLCLKTYTKYWLKLGFVTAALYFFTSIVILFWELATSAAGGDDPDYGRVRWIFFFFFVILSRQPLVRALRPILSIASLSIIAFWLFHQLSRRKSHFRVVLWMLVRFF